MLRRGGELDGVRILSPHAVELMTTNQVARLFNENGLGFGLGFQTTDWVDPKERLVGVFMIQQLPNSSDVAAKFTTLVYQAVVGAAP
jgi:CubicO group peptidase (beta-lactamase class C family)